MYKLVPVDATDEMLFALHFENSPSENYTAMISAAPNPWRLIAEAEEYKDGRRVLLFVPPYGPTTGHWSKRQDLQEGYFPVEGHWKMHSCLNTEANPTHFIPLEWLGSPEGGQ